MPADIEIVETPQRQRRGRQNTLIDYDSLAEKVGQLTDKQSLKITKWEGKIKSASNLIRTTLEKRNIRVSISVREDENVIYVSKGKEKAKE